MGQALYRKYRSKSLDEVVGQNHITDTLKQALKSGKIRHAYLLTGPRGVGKTSVARILAHAVNELDYTDDTSHIDIIEIDAASNRRIDEIRDLRDKVFIAPAQAKYKVYIIDEVHMLTREAFNALLKTLEEPPEHAIFILATTDAHKLPETIVSRTQRFSFRPVDLEKVVEHLAKIAKQEKIQISDAALQLLAEHGEGSFRDSISLLDQVSNVSQIVELADIEQLLGVPSDEAISKLASSLGKSSSSNIAVQLDALYAQGFEPAAIVKRLSQLLREQLLAGQNRLDSQVQLGLLDELLEVPTAFLPSRKLEIVLLRHATYSKRPQTQPKAALAEPVTQIATTAPATEAAPEAKEVQPSNVKPPSKRSGGLQLDQALWPELLKALKKRHNTIYGVVRMAEPDFSEPGTIKLTFAFAFHQKRISEASNRQLIGDLLQELTGEEVQIECDVKPATSIKAVQPERAAESTEHTDSQPVKTISNIFGGAELLES